MEGAIWVAAAARTAAVASMHSYQPINANRRGSVKRKAHSTGCLGQYSHSLCGTLTI